MTALVYDGTFEGFLCAVFDIYEYRLNEVDFSRNRGFQNNIFGSFQEVITNEEKSKRVWNGLEQKISRHALHNFYRAFISEDKQVELLLLQYVRYMFSGKRMAEYDLSHPAVLGVSQTAKKVYREKHRMEAFVRFQLTKDELYYAIVEPDFDVLPLIKKHFKDRYADQLWMIYDARRKYGIYYDKNEISYISMQFSEEAGEGHAIRTIYHEQEELYQQLWQRYFNSVNIAARRNMKLHITHMPKRYWKYLTEKI